MEGAEAEFGGVVWVALVKLREGRVGVLHFVGAAFHVFGVVFGGGDQGAALRERADAELLRRRFIVGVGEAAMDAGAVGEVADEGDTPI